MTSPSPMKSPDRDAADDTYLSLAEWVGTIVVLATQQNDPELREAVRDFPISFPDGAPVATEIALLVGRFANQASELATLRRRVAEMEGAMTVPAVWSEAERDGMSAAYAFASTHHGHYESIFAAAAWLLRHRSPPTRKE